MKNNISIQDVCNLLNNMLELDYSCTHELINKRVECNDLITDHPTIQVQALKGEFTKVGLLGVLNGLFETVNGRGPIVMETDYYGKIISFKQIEQTNFKQTE